MLKDKHDYQATWGNVTITRQLPGNYQLPSKLPRCVVIIVAMVICIQVVANLIGSLDGKLINHLVELWLLLTIN